MAPLEPVPLIFPELAREAGLLPKAASGGEVTVASFFIFFLFGQNRKVQQGIGGQTFFEIVRVLMIIGFQTQALPFLPYPFSRFPLLQQDEAGWLHSRESQL